VLADSVHSGVQHHSTSAGWADSRWYSPSGMPHDPWRAHGERSSERAASAGAALKAEWWALAVGRGLAASTRRPACLNLGWRRCRRRCAAPGRGRWGHGQNRADRSHAPTTGTLARSRTLHSHSHPRACPHGQRPPRRVSTQYRGRASLALGLSAVPDAS
jgi:hypothetical protein